MKNYFNIYNDKALDIVKNYKNTIYSYLEAVPSTEKQFNNITTIPATERNISNGMSNFIFGYNEFISDTKCRYTRLNVRIEIGAFDNKLNIKAVKAASLVNADLIIFASPTNPNSIYISDHSFNNNEWVTKKALRTMITNKYGVKEYQYDLPTLVKEGYVFSVFRDAISEKDKNISVNLSNSTVKKEYHSYKIDLSHISFVQHDLKAAQVCFFGYKGDTYTSISDTLDGFASRFENVSDSTHKAIYEKLRKVLLKTTETGTAYSCKIKLNCVPADMNPAIINENNEVEIFVSTDPSFCIKDNVKEDKYENITPAEKNKLMTKIKKYMKTHEEPKASWTDTEKEIFWNIKVYGNIDGLKK